MRKWIDIAALRLDEKADLPFGSEHDCWIDDTGKRHRLDRAKRQTHRELAAAMFGVRTIDTKIDYNRMGTDEGWVRVYCHNHVAMLEFNITKVARAAVRGAIDFIRRTPQMLKVVLDDTAQTLADEYLDPKDAERLLRRISLKNDVRSLFDSAMDGVLAEKYSEPNSALLRYMNAEDQFDYHSFWYWIGLWINDNDLVDELAERSGMDIDDIDEEDPDLFLHLTPEEQSECAEWVLGRVAREAPSELPSSSYFTANSKLLHRQTWLIHFTDHAYDIVRDGFTKGVGDMDRLGLTTYMSDSAKKHGGYNFAFEAGSRYAKWAESKNKYGSQAVMFQNSGVSAWHSGDEEQQIIFWGEDVDPRSIILLTKSEGDWVVNSRQGPDLFRGDFEDTVAWVMKNHQQYRRVLYGK